MDEEKKAEELEEKAAETAESAPEETSESEREGLTAAEKLATETVIYENAAKLDVNALFKMQMTSFLKTPTNWIFYGVILAAFLLIAFLCPEGFTLEGALVLTGFVVLVAVLIPLTMWIVSKKAEKNIAKTSEGGLQTLYATEEMFYYSAGDKTVGFEYGAFVKIMQNKDYYYLITYAKQMVMVAKNGFTKGDAESFYPFIVAKITQK